MKTLFMFLLFVCIGLGSCYLYLNKPRYCTDGCSTLVYTNNNDTVTASVCFKMKVIAYESGIPYLYYLEHTSDSMHIAKLVPFNNIKILKQ